METEITDSASSSPVKILLDDREMRQGYVNFCRFHVTREELILDLGFSMPNPNSNPKTGQQQMLVKITDRKVMSYISAKRMMQSLARLIKRHEQQFGVVELSAKKPAAR